ncbi:Uma2 family endonuclease [Catalinimonas niigatensis]|uniref:Uma2 family endonuclease n=1 Tax=Catalinimonas niigatensis TaxID=1397264 RepID=UPI002665A29C|nr:Uma2 family endonuclease [Catalinimonas niigatensis]WPP48459.1 Uma2 family endonuclease [Catalinimonas niigatensis]
MIDKIILKGKEMQMSDDEFFNFCQANPDLNIERSAQREIMIMSPTGSISGNINAGINAQLYLWNEKNKLGITFDSSTGFTLPDQSVKSPDAAWLSLEKWQKLSPEEQEKFAPVCPEFVVELKSKNDRLDDLQEKMKSWIKNGTQLAWLIVPESETVYIHRVSEEVYAHQGFDAPLSAEPALPGFALDFSKLRLPKS